MDNILLGEPVTFHYDAQGGRRARVINEGIPGQERITRYFSDLVHTTDGGVTTRRYFLGGTLIASREIDDTSWQMAGGARLGEAGSGVEIAAANWGGRPVLVVGLSAGAQGAAATAATVAVLLLLLATAKVAPGRRRRVIGLRLRHGQVMVVVLLFVCGSTPWPLLLRPAQAQSPPAETVQHYHTDHLGSVQLITDDNGNVVEHTRYHPYGEIRGRLGPSGNSLVPPTGDEVRHEFTGHETELNTGLIYAGARFLDPVTATFLTQDPAAQYLNPYAYGPWDPVNGTDPTGAIFGLGAILGWIGSNLWWIAPIAGAAASFGQALANGASFGQAIGAAAIGAGIGLVTGGILGGIGEAITTETLKQAYGGALIAAGIGSTAHGAVEGQYITAGVGAALLALGLVAGFSQGGNGAAGKGRGVVGAKRAGSVAEGAVDGFELSIMDRAAKPTRGELVLDLAEGRGLAQVRLDIDRFGTSVLQGAQARFDAAGGGVRLSKGWLPNTDGILDPGVFGSAHPNFPQLGLDIGPPAFISYEEFARTYIHELGHASLNLYDRKGALTAYQFEGSQWHYISQRKLGSRR